jgi:hypothetical protein
LNQRTGGIRCLNLIQRLFLECNSGPRPRTRVFATLSNLAEEQYTSAAAAKLAARNIV